MGSVKTAAGSARAETCADQNARRSLEVRVLQSELMVAALTCGQRQNYNAFVTTFRPVLKTQGAQLRTFFVQNYGLKNGPKRLNKLVTRLANSASQRSLTQSTQAFCAQTEARFKQLLSSDAKTLFTLARTNPTASDHGFGSCVEVARTDFQSNDDQN
jgi:hypothetical protein